MAVVESPSNNRVSYDPTATISVAVKIHKVVISDNVWTTQDNPIVAVASVIVVPLVHRHTPQCGRTSPILPSVERGSLCWTAIRARERWGCTFRPVMFSPRQTTAWVIGSRGENAPLKGLVSGGIRKGGGKQKGPGKRCAPTPRRLYSLS